MLGSRSLMLQRLKAAGADVMTGDEPVEVRPGVWLAFARDPEGNVLEFVQYDDVESYRPDLAAVKNTADSTGGGRSEDAASPIS